MKFLSNLQAERSLGQLLAERDAGSPEARKALHNLRALGGAGVPRVIEAFATATKEQSTALTNLLAHLLTDFTFSIYAKGLAHENKLCVAGVSRALAISESYDASRLLDLLSKEEVHKSALLDLLSAVRKRLNPRDLLKRAYALEYMGKIALFKIINDIAGPDMVPDLISRLEGKDPAIRLNIIELLSRFNQPEVGRALERQLQDKSKIIRKAALLALGRITGARDIGLVCVLLADPDLEVQSTAVDLVVKMRHPGTLEQLVKVLKNESEFARRSAVEVLNEIAEPDTIKDLLNALEDGDWWVRSRASDALAKIGGPKVMDAVLTLVGDKNDNIRRSAIEILNQTKDERAVDYLITATRDSDWWVRERAADALAELGSEKATPALLDMLTGDPRSVPAALRAIGRLGHSALLPQIVLLLDRPEKDICIEAVNAIGHLAHAESGANLKNRLKEMAVGSDDDLAKVAAQALARIGGSGLTAPRAGDEGPGTNTLLTADARIDNMGQSLDKVITLDVSSLRTGDLIEGRYRYIEKIGKGAFGTVVLVEDEVVNERLILKFLNPNISSDEEMMQRFVHELRYSRKITHQNVIRIFDFVSLGGNYAISMEYFPSHTLGSELSEQKPLPFAKASGWAQDIANGMAVAHEVGIVHRDLKPANILINDAGLLKIVDFGVAAAASSGDTQLTKTGYVIGSPKYMAPEQILGKQVDHRADIYSVGVIVYEMLTGTPPYTKGDHMSVMYQHVQGKAKFCEEINPDIPPALAAVVRKAMAVEQRKRFNSMLELREALVAAA